ncbi:MAG TPA: hypothetical protein VM658_11020 [bacterium]|nr:hypothetical protein [bacterium]
MIVTATRPAAGAFVSVEKADGFDPAGVKRVAFLPFTRIMPVEEGQQPVCPLTKKSFDACRIEDNAEAELSRIIGQALLESGAPVAWVPQSEINAARTKLKKEGGQTLSTAGAVQLAIGREVKADAVLTGFIYCFRDRSGNAYASARPAALAFCLHLIDPATGKILWSLRLHDEQVPLSSDLGSLPEFIKRKGKWITVGQMAEEAAKQVVADLPWDNQSDAGKGR